MTKRERAAHAAKWRRVARNIERRWAWCLCWGIGAVTGTYPRYYDEATPDERAVAMFCPKRGAALFWPCNNRGYDCRVIAAGLVAAMYEAGDLD